MGVSGPEQAAAGRPRVGAWLRRALPPPEMESCLEVGPSIPARPRPAKDGQPYPCAKMLPPALPSCLPCQLINRSTRGVFASTFAPLHAAPPHLHLCTASLPPTLANWPTGQLVNEWHRPPGFFTAPRTMD